MEYNGPHMKRIAVIYHANCPDGFGSAWAAWRELGTRADYFPVPPRTLPEAPLEGYREIYVLDNSFRREITQDWANQGKRVVVIDHHSSSVDDVRSVSENVFDTSHSAAILTWEHFHHGSPVPLLLRYIEDNDLWKFRLPKSRAVSCYLELFPFDFEEYSVLSKKFSSADGFKKIATEGAVMERYKESLVERIASSAYHVSFMGNTVLAVNSPNFISAVGDRLAKKHPPFGIVWSEHGPIRRFSMRSRGDFDVSKLAAKFPQGGGHPNAAGFSLPSVEPFPWKTLKKHSDEK